MKYFLRKLLFFIIPIILFLLSYEYVMHSLGETSTIPTVFEIQERNRNSLFMRKYLSQDFRNYKLYGIKRNKPEILSSGSSRMMQIRSEFFNSTYYNAGGLLHNMRDLNNFLESDIKANTILVGIDPWWFKYDNLKIRDKNKEFEFSKGKFDLTRYNSLIDYHKIISDLTKERISKNIGTNAQLFNGGFRLDGSLKTPDYRINLLLKEKKFIDIEEPKTSKRIKNGLTGRFSISKFDTLKFENSIKLVKSLVDEGKNIVVYLMPFSNESYHTLVNTEKQKDLFEFATVHMPKVLDSYGIKYIPTEHPSLYKLDDTYFIDGFHPSEIFVAIQLKRYASLFNNEIDPVKLDTLINNRFCNLLFNKSEMLTIYNESD